MPVYFSPGRKDIKRNTLPALQMGQPALVAVKKATFSMFAMENGVKEFALLTPKIPCKSTQLRMSISLFSETLLHSAPFLFTSTAWTHP